MHNLKTKRGTYKGLIGECMFKMTKKYAVLTRITPVFEWLDKVKQYLTIEQKDFLTASWRSIDSAEMEFISGKPTFNLYEVKVQNKVNQPNPFYAKPKMTRSSYEIYQKASKLGFNVYVAQVKLHEHWAYNVSLKSFGDGDFYVYRPKKYTNPGIKI